MADLPLKGYRVLDFGWVMAGPILGHLLADMGAEVIKVESKRRLDAARRGRPLIGDNIESGDAGEEYDLIPLFHAVNRGKLSISIDLSHPGAVQLIQQIVGVCDIVTENFSPGVLEKAQLDYTHLRKLNPSIIVISLYAAGAYGPQRNIRTYAPSITALSGIDSMVGYQGEELESLIGLNFADPNAGLTGLVAVLTALYHRNSTGVGQYIDVSQWEATTCLLGEAIADFSMNGRIKQPQGNFKQGFAPHGNYPCEGEDKWVSIAISTDEEWDNFCSVTENPQWSSDPRFIDIASRTANQIALDHLICKWTSRHNPYEIMQTLQNAGIASMPVLGIDEQFVDPHYRSRDTYIELNHPLIGVETIYGLPWKLSETPGKVDKPAPLLGQHNDYVLKELLGFSDSYITELNQSGLIY